MAGGRRLQGVKARGLAAVVLGALLLTLGAQLLGGLDSTELESVDARFDVRGTQTPSEKVVVVDIDTPTLEELKTFPFPRSFHARVIDQLTRAGAKAIAYDVVIAEPSEDPEEDNALVLALRRSNRVVMAATEFLEDGTPFVLGGEPEAQRYARILAGDANFTPDEDGVWRRMHYTISDSASFPLLAAERFTGRAIGPEGFRDGRAYVNFPGPARTIPTIPFHRVMRGRFDPEAVRGKLVFVGASTPSLQDIHPAPTDELMPGPELQAAAAATLIEGGPLRRPAPGVSVLLTVLVALVAPLAALFSRPLVGALAGTIGGGLYLVAAQVAFGEGWLLPVAAPAMAGALAAVGTVIVDYVSAAMERQRTRDVFARFVPPAVVDEALAEAGDDLRVRPMERVCTTLICDMRGFTTFSESVTPSRLLEIVNEMLAELTSAVSGQDGTLVTLLGDGLLAVFGTPVAQPDHADRALAAARDMAGPRMEAFNAWVKEQGVDREFQLGIGVHTGPVVAGNVGSIDRLDFTIFGDVVNTTARLEAATKELGARILLSDDTLRMLSEEPDDLEDMGELELRGRKTRLRCWALLR